MDGPPKSSDLNPIQNLSRVQKDQSCEGCFSTLKSKQSSQWIGGKKQWRLAKSLLATIFTAGTANKEFITLFSVVTASRSLIIDLARFTLDVLPDTTHTIYPGLGLALEIHCFVFPSGWALTLTPRDNFTSPINLTCMFLGGGRKPEYRRQSIF